MIKRIPQAVISPIVLIVLGVCLAPARSAEQYVTEPAKKIPVAYDVDVVVCGGGTSGTIAAVSAARPGAKTLVIDRFGRLGGNMGPGMFGGGSVHYALKDENALVNRTGLGGIPDQFLRRIIFSRFNADQITEAQRQELERKHLNVRGLRVGSGSLGYPVESYTVSYVAFKMMEEAGVEMLLSAYVTDPIMEGNKVKGVFIETKSGRLAVKAKVVIDATGEGDVAFRAGAPMRVHTSPNIGLTYAIKAVDWKKYYDYLKKNGAKVTKWFNKNSLPREADGFKYVKTVGKAQIRIRFYGHEDITVDRTGTSGTVDFSDAKQVSIMEREHRKHVFEFAKFMRKHAPGFENSYLLIVSPYLMARGGRTLDAVYNVSGSDVKAHRKFDDVVYIYFHDKSPDFCDVPYRTMLPKKIDGLIATGRSALWYGPNFRQRYSVMLHAQAAGVAAALAVADGVEPRKLNVKKLQKALVKLRCPLGDEKRIKELGLR